MPEDILQSDELDPIPHRRRRSRFSVLVAATLVFAACGSDDGSDQPAQTDVPVNEGTVKPPDDIGVGGGVPVDNLNPDVADQDYQEEFDMDGSGGP